METERQQKQPKNYVLLDLVSQALPPPYKNSPVTLVDLSDTAGGLSNTIQRVDVTVEKQGATRGDSYIFKSTPAASSRSQELGLAREALFYNHFSNHPAFMDCLPRVYLAIGDMQTGSKHILMQDLSSKTASSTQQPHIQSGYFFGNASPHNWQKDLEKITGFTSEGGSLDAELIGPRQLITHDICLQAFKTAARIHSAFWNSSEQFTSAWLRGANWLQGQGKKEWMAHQTTTMNCWKATRAQISTTTGSGKDAKGVYWDPYLVECLDASMAKISWDDFQAEYLEGHGAFTLIHGDFHPANMMWRGKKEGGGELLILDWEVVGLGSGPQDCAQFVISHMYPEERRRWEKELVTTYYSDLTNNDGGRVNPNDYTLDHCWRDYVAGGVGRWAWLLPLLSEMCTAPWTQFFHDQVLSFIRDHSVTPSNIPMPRV